MSPICVEETYKFIVTELEIERHSLYHQTCSVSSIAVWSDVF